MQTATTRYKQEIKNFDSQISRSGMPSLKKEVQVPFILNSSYAESFIESRQGRYQEVLSFDYDNHLPHNPEASFLIKVSGNSMIGAGIDSGDVLLVDREAEAGDKCVVVASINNKLLVKRLRLINNERFLFSENIKFAPIKILPDDEFDVWGVVRMVIKER